MAREGVTFEQVAAAADALVGALFGRLGISCDLDAIRLF